ncbi:class I SAM-dependent methyltransferase, partial [Moorena sp. SIO3B2]
MNTTYSEAVKTAQTYYDGAETDRLYATFWGGEHITYGIYKSSDEPIHDASKRTVETIAQTLENLAPDSRVIDLGAGYGGAARYLAKTYGCSVCCLNLSERQNQRNRQLNQEQNLAHLVEVTQGSFEDIPYPDNSFNIVWSQDAILHSSDRTQVFEEIKRVLQPGGELIFTDPMQRETCPPGLL